MSESLSFLPYAVSAFIGVGLAAATGFRIFLPLFIVSLASFMGWIPVHENFAWLSGLPTLIATTIAMVVEIAAYYIPIVDHLLDTLSIPLATIAGSVLFASQFTEIGTFPQWAFALIAGGGTAAVISSSFAGLRVASTATTGGLGNSAVNSAETVGAGMMSVLALALPIIGFIIAVILVIAGLIFARKLLRKIKILRNESATTTMEVEAIETKKIDKN